MARTPLFAALRRALARAELARRTGRHPDELAAAELARRRDLPSRRRVLGGALGAAAILPLWQACGDNVDGTARVAVIGGGTAGLHCARHLLDAGVDTTLFEASGRTGGRMFSRAAGSDGKVIELGGELIDSDHTTMMSLAAAFGLALDDLEADGAGLQKDTFYFDGAVVADAAIVAEFTPLAARMAEAAAAGDASAAAFAATDAMTIPQWLGGPGQLPATSLIRRILERAYLGEFGLEVTEQSAWNLLTLIDYDTVDPFRIYGDSDEKYHLHRGSQSIPDALAAGMTAHIELGHALVAIATEGTGYRVTFDVGGGGTDEQSFDKVVIAIPFTTLRAVDLSQSGLSDDKLAIIHDLGYGTNAKLMLGFDSRPWREAPSRATGGSVSDVGELQATWETSRGYGGAAGILTNFVGGARGVAIGNGSAEERAAEVLPWLDTVYAQTQRAYTAGSAVLQHWPTAPYHLGSYACYKPNQWEFSGQEGEPEAGLHFCGEHTSVDFQGYMEGAAESGLRAADEVLRALDVGATPRLTAMLAARRSTPAGRRTRRRRATKATR